MGKLKEKESFGEISVLLQAPFSCTIISGGEVEMMIIEDKDILGKYINVVYLLYLLIKWIFEKGRGF